MGYSSLAFELIGYSIYLKLPKLHEKVKNGKTLFFIPLQSFWSEPKQSKNLFK